MGEEHSDKGEKPEEIEITPEMIEAGALVLLRRFNLDADEREVVAAIYRAMERTCYRRRTDRP